MYKNYPAKKTFTSLLLFLLISLSSFAQVGIGTTDPKTELDVNGALSLREGTELTLTNGNNGSISLGTTPNSIYRIIGPTALFRINRITPATGSDGQIVTLINTTSQTMVIRHNNGGGPTSRRIYCPNGNNFTLSGIYSSVTLQYNTTLSKWILISTNSVGGGGSTSDDWKLTGNAGTTPGTNFLGTTDNKHLIFKTNGNENMRITNNGQVAINETLPLAGDRFTVKGANNEFAIVGLSSGDSGVGVYGENTDNGYAVEGVNYSTGIAGFFDSYSGNYSVYGRGGPIIADNVTYGGEGIMGFTDSSILGGLENGVWGSNDDASGTAVLGGTASTWVLPTSGSGVAGSSPVLGIFGYAGYGNVNNANYGNAGGNFNLDSDGDPGTSNDRASAVIAGFNNIAANGPSGGTTLPAQDSYFGGYFSGGDESAIGPTSYAYVGLRHNTTDGTDGTDYKIIGPGTVSTLINDSSGKPRIMFAPEAPEIVFQDFGVGKLTNGIARINLDPILKGSLFIDEKHPLKVYVTLEGECNGIFVTNKTSDGFTVKELQGGTSNVSFSWQIVANRADTKDVNGKVISKHIGLRLPIGPTQLKPIKKKRKERKDPTRKKLKPSSKKQENKRLQNKKSLIETTSKN